MTPEQEQREGRDDEGNRESLMIHEDVEAEDVHNHRAEQGVGFQPEASFCFLKCVLVQNGWAR